MDKRIYSLDALRAIMLLLGIVIHSAASYTTVTIFPWPVKDKSVSVLFDYLVLNIHSFRIPIFFVLAGFFLAMQYNKRGIKITYLNRVFRILFPFIASMILIAPLTRIIFMYFVQKLEWNVILNSIISLKIYINIFTGHLWFLYYLFIVISIFHIVKIAKIKVLKHLHEQVGKILNRNSFAAFVLFSFISFVCILIQQKGYIESNIKLTPDLLILLTYFVYFVFGYILFSFKNSFSKIFEKWRLYLLISFLLSVVYFLLFIAIKEKQQIVFIITSSFICSLLSWSMVFGLFGFFYTKLNKESKIFSTISFSSYWVYIMHLPLTFFISLVFYNSSMPHYLKFLVNVALTYLILMILYKLVVEKTVIGKFLNGKKKNIE